MRRWPLIVLLALGAVVVAGAVVYQVKKPAAAVPMAAAEAAGKSAWDFNLTAIDGQALPMRKFQGEVVLLVNTASFCGFTPQYDGLQAMQTTYAARGFTVIGVPSGNFLDQEYGTNKDISTFCKAKFGIQFPLAERSDVVGGNAIPIYRWAAARLGPENAPQWNFHKYLIGRDGQLIGAWGSKVEPMSPELRGAVEKAISAPVRS